MQSPSWMTSQISNFAGNASHFQSNGGGYRNRKRKIDESDVQEKSQHKIFLTEEKLVKTMQTLSLDFSVNKNNTSSIFQTSQEDDEENETNNLSAHETQFELHKLLKDHLKNDDLHDNFINKMYDLERKNFSMQLVPYMPIHPAQLNNNNNHNDKEQEDNQKKISSVKEIKKDNDDHLFKKPFQPTPYTVEEPCDNTTKRIPRMKRSYSQSMRSNSNLSVVELKTDPLVCHPQTDYFIFEPTTPSLLETSTTQLNSSVSSDRPSIRITEYFDFLLPDIDIQSIVLSDVNDKMDDDEM